MPATNSGSASLASRLRQLPNSELEEWLSGLSQETARGLLFDWRLWARPEQLAPEGEWRVWLYLAGRGAGKSRTGAEWVREQVCAGRKRIALLAPTAADARDTVVEGESGLLSVFPPSQRPRYEPSKRRITFHTGAIATTYSADEPERLRGPQSDAAWIDELGAMRNARTALDMLLFGLRLGPDPRAMVSTTPKPIAVLRELMDAPSTVVVRGSTYDNRANLADAFFEQIISRYEGSRMGRQEILGELLEDLPGALWSRAMLDEAHAQTAPDMQRVVVAIDPAVTSGEDADSTGIAVIGKGVDGFAYVLADKTCKLSPDGWARRAVEAYEEFGADRIIGEVNNGGDLVKSVIQSAAPKIPYKKVHASRGKRLRAEPVAALYEQGRVKHLPGLDELEDEMVTFVPEGMDHSPDRTDALVHAMTELMLNQSPEYRVRRLALG